MRNVSYQLKRSLNEKRYHKGSIDNYNDDLKNIINVLNRIPLGKRILLDITIDSEQFGEYFTSTALSRSMGNFVESYILSILLKKLDNNHNNIKQTNNDTYDFIYETEGKTYFIEVKAYKDGHKENITFTNKQRQLFKGNTFLVLIYVDYSFSPNNIFKINNILFGTYNDVANTNGNISRHGGRTRNMYATENDITDDKLIGSVFNRTFINNETYIEQWNKHMVGKVIRLPEFNEESLFVNQGKLDNIFDYGLCINANYNTNEIPVIVFSKVNKVGFSYNDNVHIEFTALNNNMIRSLMKKCKGNKFGFFDDNGLYMIIDTKKQNIIVNPSKFEKYIKNVKSYNIKYDSQMSIDDIDYAATLLTYV